MDINPIKLDALTSALESGESIDTDDHRDTVVDLIRDYCDKPAVEVVCEPEPVKFKAYPNLPRV